MFSAALRFATFLLVPDPSAVWFPTFTCITNSRRRGRPRSVRSRYSGSFSFFACWIWASLLMGFIPWPYSWVLCNLTIDFVFFLILGFTRSTVGRGGNFFSSSRTAIAAFFFEIFLLFLHLPLQTPQLTPWSQSSSCGVGHSPGRPQNSQASSV